MRAVIDYDAVVAAAESLEKEGQRPTIDRVRERLREHGFGRGGSATTVSVHLRRWKASRIEVAAARPPTPLPDPVVRAAQAIREELVQEKNAEIEAIREEARREVDAARQELAKARETLLARDADLAEARSRFRELESVKDDALREAASEQARREALEAALGDARQRAENAEARADAALVQAREVVETERARLNESIASKEAHLQLLQQTLDALRVDATATEKALVTEKTALARRLDTLIDSLNAAQSRAADALRDLAVQDERAQALTLRNGELERALAEARTAASRLEEEVLRLRRRLEQTEEEVRALRADDRDAVRRLSQQIESLEGVLKRLDGTPSSGKDEG